MKLKDKRNGEAVEIKLVRTNCKIMSDYEIETIYGEKLSLETLNKYFEDYKPAEPLIKDEKVRKAVKAWAEATGTTSIDYWCGAIASRQNDSSIDFDERLFEEGDNYTITELCGGEEE